MTIQSEEADAAAGAATDNDFEDDERKEQGKRKQQETHRFDFQSSGTLESQPSSSDVSVRDLSAETDDRASAIWYNSWSTLIALVALFDFVAKAVADYIRKDEEPEHHPHENDKFMLGAVLHRRHKQALVDVVDTDSILVLDFIRFLDKYSIAISAVFSILWFMNAFVKARARRDNQLKEIDRQHVLAENDKDNDDNHYVLKEGAWGAYYQTVLLNMLLLPISFYMVAYHILSFQHTTASDILLDEDEEITIGWFEYSNHDKHHHYRRRQHHGDDDPYSFQVHLSKSTLFVVTQFLGTVFVRLTGMRLRASINRQIRLFTKSLAFGALRNPAKVVRKVKRILRALRWIKYLTPLVGAGNKLRGNVMDLLQKRRQRIEARKAERARQLLWKNSCQSLMALAKPERKEKAAVILQRVWRRYQLERTIRALHWLQCDQEQIAAQRLQHAFRCALKRARARILKKKQELQSLKRRQEKMRRQKEVLSVKDRRRMYELQDELGREASKLLNQKMLLRPNTRFAVAWKILFVVCVVLEISQLALAPILEEKNQNHHHHRNSAKHGGVSADEPLPIQRILERHLVPTPVSEWPSCRPLETIQPNAGYLSTMKHTIKKAISHFKRKEEPPLPSLWYCQKPFTAVQQLYITILQWFIYEILVLVGIVCFADVFVTFFTGELDPDSGFLIPKPFFTRWILPGIALQLLVNPEMVTVSKYTYMLLDYAHHVGPLRVYRWAAALFYPFGKIVFHWFVHDVWRPLVKRNNSHALKEDPFAMTANSQNNQNSLPEHTKMGQRRSTLLQRRSTLLQRRSTLLQRRSSIANRRSTLSKRRSTMLQAVDAYALACEGGKEEDVYHITRAVPITTQYEKVRPQLQLHSNECP